ncbi:hypothetical protein BDV93DRAFT_512273 [Ceratobasidium sp. AG-I]|nr:hypothetical protein BDV93DRAFT_512273 [Ceratobasidium sp. AG-I]
MSITNPTERGGSRLIFGGVGAGSGGEKGGWRWNNYAVNGGGSRVLGDGKPEAQDIPATKPQSTDMCWWFGGMRGPARATGTPDDASGEKSKESIEPAANVETGGTLLASRQYSASKTIRSTKCSWGSSMVMTAKNAGSNTSGGEKGSNLIT